MDKLQSTALSPCIKSNQFNVWCMVVMCAQTSTADVVEDPSIAGLLLFLKALQAHKAFIAYN